MYWNTHFSMYPFGCPCVFVYGNVWCQCWLNAHMFVSGWINSPLCVWVCRNFNEYYSNLCTYSAWVYGYAYVCTLHALSILLWFAEQSYYKHLVWRFPFLSLFTSHLKFIYFPMRIHENQSHINTLNTLAFKTQRSKCLLVYGRSRYQKREGLNVKMNEAFRMA